MENEKEIPTEVTQNSLLKLTHIPIRFISSQRGGLL